MMSGYDEWKELVLIRLNSMPSNIKISIGSLGTLSKEDLIEHVKKDDAFGKLIVEMQKKYLQAMKTGFSDG